MKLATWKVLHCTGYTNAIFFLRLIAMCAHVTSTHRDHVVPLYRLACSYRCLGIVTHFLMPILFPFASAALFFCFVVLFFRGVWLLRRAVKKENENRTATYKFQPHVGEEQLVLLVLKTKVEVEKENGVR